MMKVIKRLVVVPVLLILVLSLAVPVSAEELDHGWEELLEYSSVQTNGSNWFTMAQTGSVTIPLYRTLKLRKIDMLIWNPSGQRPTKATVTSGSTTTNLDIYGIGGNLTRITGYLPQADYSSVTVKLTKSTTTSQRYEVLSCKVTPLGVQEFLADAEVYIDSWGVTGFYDTNYQIPFWYDEYGEVPVMYEWLSAVIVRDWQKYDRLSIWGSATSASIESIRASIATTALDYEVNFIDVEGQDTQIYGDILATPEVGKFLFNVTIDLSGADRTLTDPLYLYFTGSFNTMVSAYFNCQYVNGSVAAANTAEVTWWNRFTGFMNGLFGSSDSDSLDNLGGSSDSISQGASDIHEFEQSQQAVLDTNFAAIQNTVTFTGFIPALAFVQRYANMTFDGIADYTIVLTLPLFLGLFFYLCSRIPGVTRWKSRPPKSKGGGT